MRKITALSFVAAAAIALSAAPVFAHGFGERYTLPIPLSYFLIGAAATVAASFVVIGFFVTRPPGAFQYPRVNLFRVPVLGAALRHGALLGAVKLLGVAVFLLVVVAGLIGVNKPVENFSPTFVWIIWWVGMGYVSAFIGNAWALLNPWRTIYEVVERFTRDEASAEAPMRYPAGLGVWPAVALLFLFAWLENVYTGSSVPFKLSMLILLYSVITWAGMALFGKEAWLRRGEAFSVLFGLFAKFSPTELRSPAKRGCLACVGGGEDSEDKERVDCLECFRAAPSEERQFNLRPFAVGLVGRGDLSVSMLFFVLLALATVTFDGLSETDAWQRLQDALHPVASALPFEAFGTLDTLWLLVIPAAFAAVYLVFSWVLRKFEGSTDHTVIAVARAFVLSLVPIALAYNFAHFLSFLAIQGQGIIPLISDPFGWGWNIFGTADYLIDINVLSVGSVWWASIAAIVIGHVVSVYVAHVIALGRMPTSALAARSQYPMLALMVAYTATSLWIIAQPIAD